MYYCQWCGQEVLTTNHVCKQAINDKMETVYLDYPSESLDERNPYKCCSSCGKSVPEINGKLEGHYEWCEWRKKMEANLSNVSRLVDKHKLYVVMEYIRDLDMMTINSIWKSKELATLRALHIDGYVNEHLLEDWSL